MCLCLLHHPPLDEFTLLTGVAAVHDTVGSLHQLLDDGELFFYTFVFNELDAEPLGNHGQR